MCVRLCILLHANFKCYISSCYLLRDIKIVLTCISSLLMRWAYASYANFNLKPTPNQRKSVVTIMLNPVPGLCCVYSSLIKINLSVAADGWANSLQNVKQRQFWMSFFFPALHSHKQIKQMDEWEMFTLMRTQETGQSESENEDWWHMTLSVPKQVVKAGIQRESDLL